MVIENTEIENKRVYQACVCGRCGKIYLRRYLSTEEYDGGFTKQAMFEDLPNGWDYNTEINTTLCTECSNSFKIIIKDFMKSKE